MKNKKVLITGGAGFIGSNLSIKLIDRGYEVSVIDNLSKQIHGENPEEDSDLYKSIKEKVNFYKGDILDKDLLKKAIEGVDVIVHFAAETGTGQSMYEVKRYADVNVSGTALLLDVLVNENHSVSKVVVASSRAIYGEGKYISKKYGEVYPKHRISEDMLLGDFKVKYKDDSELTLLATDEDSKIHPSSVYGITKQNQEQMVMTVCPSIGIHPVAFRYQNVYGPGQSLKNPYTGILSIFSTQIRNGNKINIFEDGSESRDFVFIDDVIHATILGIERDEANEQVYNVGTGEATDVLTVANKLCENYKINVPIEVTGKFRIGDIRHNYADLSKITEELGFIPKIDFNEGIKRFTKWVLTQELGEDKYESSINEMKNKGLFK